METVRPFRRSRAEADLIAACAAVHGVSCRSVRNWRTSQDPRWKSFLRERATLAASQPTLALGPSVPIGPAEEEAAAAQRFASITQLADRAVERGDHGAAERLLRAAEASHRLLAAVRAARVQHDAALGEVARVEISRVLEVTRAVAAEVHRLPHLLAERCNPADPATARAALQSWLDDDFRRGLAAALRNQPATDETATTPN